MHNTDDTINRAWLLEQYDLKHAQKGTRAGCETMLKYEVADMINDAPAAKPQVAHGRWIRTDDWTDECSECGYAVEQDIEDRSDYCPNCGAKMDAGANNGK